MDNNEVCHIDTLEGAKKLLSMLPNINTEVGKEGGTLLELACAFTLLEVPEKSLRRAHPELNKIIPGNGGRRLDDLLLQGDVVLEEGVFVLEMGIEGVSPHLCPPAELLHGKLIDGFFPHQFLKGPDQRAVCLFAL